MSKDFDGLLPAKQLLRSISVTMSSMPGSKTSCCSSPGAILYWLCVTAIAWAVLSLIGAVWQPLHATSAITILFAMSVGCFANWSRNSTYHCLIDGPLFLVAGGLFLLRRLGVVHFPSWAIWLPLGAGVCISFCLEWRVARQAR